MATSFGALFHQGGWVMYPLLVFSILTWAVVLERAYVFMTLRPKLKKLSQSLLNSLKSGDTQSAKQLCHAETPQIAEIFLGTLDSKADRDFAERVTDRNRAKLMAYFKKNLWVLATIASASPFVGLLGTVVGIVRAFHSMAAQGAGGFSVVAGGISEALIATAAGLIVAIVALITYNVFLTAANQTTASLKISLEELIDTSFRKTAAA